jgi:hypothetical protein
MSIPVAIDEIRAKAAEFGERALLVSASESGAPHVSSVVPEVGSDHVMVGAGKRTRDNVVNRPEVTVVWPGGPDDDYCLIVDGVAETGPDDDGPIAIRPTSAVLHRLADAPADLPQCVRLD